MAQVNPLTRELLVKLVYYGPGLGGKTTSLQCIHGASPPETRGQIVSLATPVDRTLYFDFLPLRSTDVRGHSVRLQLFTVPGQVYFNATRKLVLTGADGVVFVADSQRMRHDANLESMENLATNLEGQSRSLTEMPLVLQYNKRDLPGVMDVEEMDQSLNALGAPAFPTVAASGDGVLSALDALVQAVIEDLERRNALGAAPKALTEHRFARTEEALEEHIGRASEAIHRESIDAAFRSRDTEPPPARASGDKVSLNAARERADAVVKQMAKAARTASGVPPAPDFDADGDGDGAAAAGDEPWPGGGGEPNTVDQDVIVTGEFSAGSVIPPAQTTEAGPSWVSLFPDDAAIVRLLEQDLMRGNIAEAIARCDGLAQRTLEHAGRQAGVTDAGLQPALIAPLLGVEGARWLAFKRLVRRARAGGPVDMRDGLQAYALLIDVRLRRNRLL